MHVCMSSSGNGARLPGSFPQLAGVCPVAVEGAHSGGRRTAVGRMLRRRVGVAGDVRRRRRLDVPALGQTQGRARLHRRGSDRERTRTSRPHMIFGRLGLEHARDVSARRVSAQLDTAHPGVKV